MSAVFTLSVNVFDDVAPMASVAVTVNVVSASVPGRRAGHRARARVERHPDPGQRRRRADAERDRSRPATAVTGTNDAIAVPLSPTVAATACVVVSAAFTVSVNVLDDVPPTLSVAVTVNVVRASVPVGVPLTAPVAALKDMPMPVSVAAELMPNVIGAVPPAAVTGTNDAIATPTSPTLLATACVVVTGPFTLSVNVFDDVAFAASVAVTVNVVSASGPVGVPLNAPVLPLNVIPMPVSVAAGLTAKVIGAVPPAAVTGVNDAIATPCVPTVAATACVVVSGGFTVSVNVFDDVVDAASVAVTVNVVVARVPVGVPLTAPVAVLNDSPIPVSVAAGLMAKVTGERAAGGRHRNERRDRGALRPDLRGNCLRRRERSVHQSA